MTDALLTPNPEKDPKLEKVLVDNSEIVVVLRGYKQEALDARDGGASLRGKTWAENLDLYWGRYDFSEKADWQSQEPLPEAAMLVDRWAASNREALVRAGNWYTIDVPGDTEGDLSPSIRKFMDFWLDRCNHTATGQIMSFDGVFEEQMKLAAMMVCSLAVTWKSDRHGRGYVAVESEDPRNILVDATGRHMYRIRSRVIDLHDLLRMVGEKDSAGAAIYDVEEIEKLTAHLQQEMAADREALTGQGQNPTSTRKPIHLDEYLSDIVLADGTDLGQNLLTIVANEQFIIRGPEPNPFWHQGDWILIAPAIVVPLSAYGRSYMENWAPAARAYVELVNLALDGVFTTVLNAFAMVPEMLENPTEMLEGVHPNKIFQLTEGSRASDFFAEVDLGSLSPEVLAMITALKQIVKEGSAQNEITLGQLSGKADTTATEITEAGSNSTALTRSIARTIETWLLEPTLQKVWATALQHFDPQDPDLQAHVGPEILAMLDANRKTLASGLVTFKVKAISGMIERAERLRDFLKFLQVVAQNEMLMQAVLQEIPAPQLVRQLAQLFDVTLILDRSSREQQIGQLLAQAQRGQGGEQQGQQQQQQPTSPPVDPQREALITQQAAAKLKQSEAAAAGAAAKAQEAAQLGPIKVATARRDFLSPPSKGASK